jgi:DNA-binding NarL/FixJ family response regulator
MAQTSEAMAQDIARLAREVSQLSPRDRTRMFKLVGTMQRGQAHLPVDAEDQMTQLARRGWDLLTLREEQVLLLVVGGLVNKQIAARLGISQRTVELHRSRCMHKLCARNTADLCRIVSALGVLEERAAG